MKKNHLSTETLVFEIISAIAALFYMGLQVYYGIVYGAGAVRIVMNVLILILVYMGLTVLAIYPEYERTHPDYTGYTQRFANKPVVSEAVERVNKRKGRKNK